MESETGLGLIYRVIERLQAEVSRTAESSKINGLCDRYLLMENEPYKDACQTLRTFFTILEGVVGECEHCKRKIFFSEKYFDTYVMEKCYCGAWWKIETTFTGENILIERKFD